MTDLHQLSHNTYIPELINYLKLKNIATIQIKNNAESQKIWKQCDFSNATEQINTIVNMYYSKTWIKLLIEVYNNDSIDNFPENVVIY